jgi:DNA-binding transcriptional ArsR family regulator
VTGFVDAARALADPSRVRALAALRGRELCACQIVELLGLAPSTVSKHMALLKQAGLVASRKEGRWAYYRRTRPEPASPEAGAMAWLDDALARDRDLRDDAARLKEILKWTPLELCRRKSRG